MKLLLLYLKRHYKIILMIGLFILVFALVFSLYDLPVEAVWYATLLCAVIGAVLFAVGYGGYLKRHRELVFLQKRVTLSLEELPSPKGALEADYQELLCILYKETLRLGTNAETERRDMMDYYTMWAHQIKTPIAAMSLLLQSEENGQNAALQAELLHIEQYVEMVLSYLRLDSESSDLLLRTCDLDSVIRQAVRKYARLFILKKLSLDFRESGIRVLTDEKWLLFVIEQLLSNALKYTNEGHISIYTEEKVLVVADTGIGICAEDLPRVFEKGFTGYNGREDKKSTGIGLYLCRRICEKLGHKISISSEKGHGTSVRIDMTGGEQVIE
ncbi:MAG TPA: sensor histidine kinase [Oscillospiraceae bacterium]|nr:sensor histidine kinase [Oscillospiraceae bacterium]HRW57176.1 sensor histidine kinase [Oscillospiraceae bacterium]